MRDDVDRAGVQHGEEHDVAGRAGAVGAHGGSVADLVGECLSLGGVAAHELHCVAVLGGARADGGRHVA